MQELAPGDQLGAYHVLSIIGRGGMGVVYLAEHANLERRVALKVLAPQFSADPNFRTRFERESRLAASLDQASKHISNKPAELIGLAKLYRITGHDPLLPPPSFREHAQFYSPQDWERLKKLATSQTPESPSYELDMQLHTP